MFKIEYINELLTGNLSKEGYKHFISVVASFVRKYNWPKIIVVSSQSNTSKYWSIDEITELTHQFFEWALSRGKFEHLNKIPENYLSYYFSQILISFVANCIKKEQQKEGLSYEKCKELVLSICRENYIIDTIEGKEYVYINSFSNVDLKSTEDFENAIVYLSKIPVKESTKHFRPIVKLAIEDIFNSIDTPIPLSKLTETVFGLLDPKSFGTSEINDESIEFVEIEKKDQMYDKIIQIIISGLTKDDAKLLFGFLFQSEDRQSLAEMAKKYNIPKSTFSYKVDSFKKKIVANYTPVNEQDGVLFMQNLFRALDKLSN